MSSRQVMRDAVIRHQMYLNRYSGSINVQLVSFVNKLKTEVLRQLEGENISDLSKARFKNQITELQSLSDALKKDINSKVSTNMLNLARYEVGYTQRLIERSTKVFDSDLPTLKQIKAAVFTNILDKTIPTVGGYNVPGKTIQETLDDFSDNAIGQALDSVRTGYALGQDNGEISNNISEALEGQISRTFATTLARTITNYTASTAKLEFYNQNTDVLDGYEVVAVLDAETTLICSNLDGQIFDIDDFTPPPYHFNCRSTFIGVVSKKFTLSLKDPGRPAVDEKGNAIDDVNGSTKYTQFLDRQSTAFVRQFLGPERAKLYDAGLPLRGFVDDHYRPITLTDLHTADNDHFFEIANMDKKEGA